jgi:hypothetical protein
MLLLFAAAVLFFSLQDFVAYAWLALEQSRDMPLIINFKN